MQTMYNVENVLNLSKRESWKSLENFSDLILGLYYHNRETETNLT